MKSILEKYADLLTDYCLDLNEGELLYISTTTLAEPLVREVYKSAIKRGAHVETNLSFCEQGRVLLDYGSEDQISYVSPIHKQLMSICDAYLHIRAPFNLREHATILPEASRMRSQALKEVNQVYFDRTADGSMKRSLCQFPTQAAAQEAGMSLSEYEHFVYNACRLFEEDPKGLWLETRTMQQRIVDLLNQADQVQYKNKHSDVRFSVKGRLWMNSDGRTNMPSGEVFTGPVEDSVEGYVYFDLPSVYQSNEVRGITLEIEGGEVKKWTADVGQETLDSVMQIEGARRFGEVAIGTNYHINKATKNILFDEKIGGTIHMAIGQSYKQTGGVNESAVHWDMIADMRDGGEILVDGVCIYQNGQFLI